MSSGGLVLADGAPVCQWVFTALNFEAYNLLRAYWNNEPARRLYMSTRQADDTFADFFAVGLWPNLPTPDTNTFLNLIIEWTRLEAAS